MEEGKDRNENNHGDEGRKVNRQVRRKTSLCEYQEERTKEEKMKEQICVVQRNNEKKLKKGEEFRKNSLRTYQRERLKERRGKAIRKEERKEG